MTIYVDTREINSLVPEFLNNMDKMFVWKKLEVGDYIIETQNHTPIVIERKSAEDYISSLIDGRLNNQLFSLSRNFEISYIIIEGNIFEALKNHENLNRNAILSSMTTVTLKRSPIGKKGVITIIPVENAWDTAYIIKKIDDTIEKNDIFRIPKMQKIEWTHEERAALFLTAIEGIGPNKAKNLLKKFKSIKNVANAEIDEISQTNGIGKILAKRIYDFFRNEVGEIR